MFVGENKVVFEMIFAITDNNAKRNKRRDYNNKVVVSKQKKNKKKYPSEIVTRKFEAFGVSEQFWVIFDSIPTTKS